MNKNEVFKRRMKKTGILIGSLLVIGVLLFIIASSGNLTTDDRIGQMISDYGKGQENAWKNIEKNIAKIKEEDQELGAVWENIMNFWSYANTEMEVQLDKVPENLPEDDSFCVVILGKKLNDDGTMTEELIGRLELGLAIAEQYPNCYIAVTGGGTADKNPNVTEGGLMGQWLLEQGLSENRLIVEDKAPDTVGNAANTFSILKEKYESVDSVVILTSDYHVARGSILFHSTFMLDAYKTGTEPIEIAAGVGYYTGEESYESFELQAKGVRSVAENCGYFKAEGEGLSEDVMVGIVAAVIGTVSGIILITLKKKKNH
ncbi:MAG: YdcF family protein [Lachnospiraceae bacterium]|nr:YdcF family protein [Lachnospiraceae bacterium]